MKVRRVVLAGLAVLFLGCYAGQASAQNSAEDLATIKSDLRTGFGNGGWNLDRYKNLEPLKAKSKITICDIKGPGIIRHIHTTRHKPKDLLSRGVVLEIWYDDAKEPAVVCPLADFFGDGCNGKSQYFSSNLIECAPWSYNCYIPMPFKKCAKVILRNDTERNVTNYSYVEWENLPEWKDSLGYFHATFQRKNFRLTKNSDELFFKVDGTGHILGRQFSVVTDEPYFKSFNFVMEANNEINIDGKKRQVDYLGSEDSFTFSWGFQTPFIGLHAGMPYINLTKDGLNELSIYRFHDHMPIRFNKSLEWRVNWTNEHHFFKNPKFLKAVADDGCRVDYSTVFYWYQNTPGGFKHQKLPSCEDRQKVMLRYSKTAEAQKPELKPTS